MIFNSAGNRVLYLLVMTSAADVLCFQG